MAEPKSPVAALRELTRLQRAHELSILRISEPILSSASQPRPDSNNTSLTTATDPTASAGDASQRTSDVSNSSLSGGPTPASLEADLTHYRELFAKLRFSYVEQVTKEKFIRAIVGDPPVVVGVEENAVLEKENAAAKGQLKGRKLEVQGMVAELGNRGRQLARGWEDVKEKTDILRELPDKIKELETHAAELRAAQEIGEGEDPQLHLSLTKTLSLVAEKKQARLDLDRRLEQLSSLVPRKQKEVERLQAELGPLEARRQNSATAAREAKRRKENALGGVQDDLEERGRWWRAADAALRGMLEVEG
jgi:hypothetical protein